jgi:hypothetical protein
MNTRLHRVGLGVMAFGLLALAGCESKVADPRPAETARLRLVHGTVESAALDLAVDGHVVIQNVSAAGTSGYADVPAGTRTLEVSVSGSGQQVVSKVVTLTADKDYSLLVSGTLTDPGDILVSDTAYTPNPSKAKIRVINAAASGPPVDVYLTAPGADLASEFPLVDPFVPGVDTSQFPGFVERDPGSWEIRYTNDGTINVLLSTGPFVMSAGQLLTVILENDNSGRLTFRMIDETPHFTPQGVFLRVVHASPTAGPVAVHVTDPGADLSQPHLFIAPFTYGADSSQITFLLPSNGNSRDLEVRFTGVSDLNVITSSGPFTVLANQAKRVTLRDSTGGGYEAVVTDEP